MIVQGNAGAMPALLGLLTLLLTLLLGSAPLARSPPPPPPPPPLQCKWSFPLTCTPGNPSTTKCTFSPFDESVLRSGLCVPSPRPN